MFSGTLKLDTLLTPRSKTTEQNFHLFILSFIHFVTLHE